MKTTQHHADFVEEFTDAMLSRANMKHDSDEILMLRSQVKCLRARVEGIAAQIEDSEYFGKISPRGAPKLLTEIADSCRVCIDTVDGIARRSALPNAQAEGAAK